MKLINADYLTGRIFTEADLKDAHTCYDSIRAIIESMKSEDVLNKIKAEIVEYKDDKVIHYERNEMIDIVLGIIDKYMERGE